MEARLAAARARRLPRPGRSSCSAARLPRLTTSWPSSPHTSTGAPAHACQQIFLSRKIFLREFRVRCRVQDLSSTSVTSVSASLHTATVARREVASSQQEVRARRARAAHSWYLDTHHQHTCCQSSQHRSYRLENIRIYLFL